MIYLIFKCVQCNVFQVKSDTKAKKWSCTMCGTKQSKMRVYSSATKARELRPLVQQYNMARGLAEQRNFQNFQKAREEQESDDGASEQDNDNNTNNHQEKEFNEWSQFIEPESPQEQIASDDDEADGRFTTRIPSPKKRQRKKSTQAQRKKKKQLLVEEEAKEKNIQTQFHSLHQTNEKKHKEEINDDDDDNNNNDGDDGDVWLKAAKSQTLAAANTTIAQSPAQTKLPAQSDNPWAQFGDFDEEQIQDQADDDDDDDRFTTFRKE